MSDIDPETIERYNIIKETRVCPDCGSDIEQTTLGKLLEKVEGGPKDGENPDAIAFVCSEPECIYAITINELPDERAA